MFSPRLAHLALNVLLTGVYFAAGKLGLSLAFAHPSASLVWPPTGIALALFLVVGYRVWPAIALGAFLVNVTTAGTVLTSLAIAVGNTLEGLVGAYLVRRYARGPGAFERGADVVRFAVLAGLLSTTVSATVGVTSLAWAGFAAWEAYGATWLTWWLGDVVGALVVFPVLALWLGDPRVRWTTAQACEAVVLGLSLVLVGQVVFGPWLPTGPGNYPLSYLCVPSLVWAAFRFGPRETATAMFLLSAIAIAGTLRGFGPFVRDTLHESLLLLQAFMGATAVLALAFAAVVAARRRAEDERERLLQELRHALDHVKVLRGLLPICASCKRIRTPQGHWEAIETYIQERSEADFTHSICPDCTTRLYPQFIQRGR